LVAPVSKYHSCWGVAEVASSEIEPLGPAGPIQYCRGWQQVEGEPATQASWALPMGRPTDRGIQRRRRGEAGSTQWPKGEVGRALRATCGSSPSMGWCSWARDCPFRGRSLVERKQGEQRSGRRRAGRRRARCWSRPRGRCRRFRDGVRRASRGEKSPQGRNLGSPTIAAGGRRPSDPPPRWGGGSCCCRSWKGERW
jgi:hypothetical protein